MKVATLSKKIVSTVSMGVLSLGLMVSCGGSSKSSDSGSDTSAADLSKTKYDEPTLSVCKDRHWAENNSDGRFCSFKQPEETYFNARATDISKKDGQSFVQQGRTPGEAIREALELCSKRTSSTGFGGTCTISKQFVAKLLPRDDGSKAAAWACKVQENKPLSDSVVVNRGWGGPAASTVHEAMANAMNYCAKKAGIQCQIVKCINTDYNKAQTLVLADNNESDG